MIRAEPSTQGRLVTGDEWWAAVATGSRKRCCTHPCRPRLAGICRRLRGPVATDLSRRARVQRARHRGVIRYPSEQEAIAPRQDLVGRAEQWPHGRFRAPIDGGEVSPATITVQRRGPALQISGDIRERRIRQQIGPLIEEWVSDSSADQRDEALRAVVGICFCSVWHSRP
jgi:hypothetical protein